MSRKPQPENETRERLIQAAIEVFAERAYGDVATRELAERAKVALSAIGYHFGTKLELYIAAANEVVSGMEAPLTECFLRHSLDADDPVATLRAFMDDVAEIFLASGRDVLMASRFSLRELAVDGPARTMIMDRVVEPTVGHVASLLARASNDAITEEVAKARAETLFGPITLYRLLNNHSFATRDASELASSKQVILEAIRMSVSAMIAASRS